MRGETTASAARGRWILAGTGLAALLVLLITPAVTQNPGFHAFADQRTRLGIPNAWNVLSNLPFLLVGLVGLRRLAASRGDQLPWQRAACQVLFGCVAAVAFGSGYYHLAPDDGRLVWDRFPIAVGFMAWLALVVGERVEPRLGRRLLAPLLLLGTASVGVWWWTGDLRVYGIVQYGSMLALLLLAGFCPAQDPRALAIWRVIALYALAKVAEIGAVDRGLFTATAGWLSGHTLKHLLAAWATWVLVLRYTGAAASAGAALADPVTAPRRTR